MTEQQRKDQLEKLVREISSLQNAMKIEDPSLARGVYLDKDLKWAKTVHTSRNVRR